MIKDTNARVLLVEDDDSLRGILAVCLRMAGFRVDGAACEKSALARFEATRPDAVVSDLILPAGEGLRTVEAMHREAPQLPIVVMSGGGLIDASDLLRLASSLGASAALQKPFRPAELVDVVRGLVA